MTQMFADHANDGQGQKMYDIGSYDHNGSYRAVAARFNWNYIGVDIEAGPNVDIVISDTDKGPKIKELPPMPLIISGQCMEHVKFPWIWLSEIEKILSPSGRLFLIAPAAWPEHRYPIDCWRFLPDGMRALAEHVGLIVKKTGMLPTPDEPIKHIDCWALMEKPQ
jgi:hypothetical protein